MLYFKPFMGDNGQNFHIPAYTYKAWAEELMGIDVVPGWDSTKTIAENIDDMLGFLKGLLKDVTKSLAIIWDVFQINNLTYTKPDYEIVPGTPSPLFRGFNPYLMIDGTTATAFAQWSNINLPLLSKRDGVTPQAGANMMTINEGADYLTKIQTDISMTISVLRIMKSFY